MGEKCLINDPDLGTQQLTHSLLNRKMPAPKPSKYLKERPGDPSHTQIRSCCSKHRRDNKHHCPGRDFPWTFLDFYRKTPKSRGFARYVSKLQQWPHAGIPRFSCYPRFPWLVTASGQGCSSGSQQDQPRTSCSSRSSLGPVRFHTQHHNLQKLFFFFFFPRYLGCASLIFRSFIRQQAEPTAEHPCEMAGTEWGDVASPKDKDLLWVAFEGGTAGCLPSPKTMMTSSYKAPKQERPGR